MRELKQERVPPSPSRVDQESPLQQKDNGDASKERQNLWMRAVAFCVFIGLFVAVCTCTMLAVFAGIGNPTEDERSLLFKGFIVEVGVVVIALVARMFGLPEKLSRRVTDDESGPDGTGQLLRGILSDLNRTSLKIKRTRAAAEGFRSETPAKNVEKANPGRPKDYWETVVESVSAAETAREVNEGLFRKIKAIVSQTKPDDFGSIVENLSEMERLLSAGRAKAQQALDQLRGHAQRGQSNGGRSVH